MGLLADPNKILEITLFGTSDGVRGHAATHRFHRSVIYAGVSNLAYHGPLGASRQFLRAEWRYPAVFHCSPQHRIESTREHQPPVWVKRVFHSFRGIGGQRRLTVMQGSTSTSNCVLLPVRKSNIPFSRLLMTLSSDKLRSHVSLSRNASRLNTSRMAHRSKPPA